MKSFSKIICLILAGLIFVHSNYLLFYCTLYSVNVAGLTESCCEKIVVNCNAHCYLDKKMNEETENSAKGLSTEAKLKISEFLVKADNNLLNLQISSQIYSDHNFSIPSAFSKEIEHPPQI